MSDIRNYIHEKYFIQTEPDDREAMDKYGFWLDPAETLNIEGVKHYRVIFPHSVKGGWAPNYDVPSNEHIPAEAHMGTLKYGRHTTKQKKVTDNITRLAR